MSAERIQRKRTKGWRMPEGAVYVGRPSRWGNPYWAGGWANVHGWLEGVAYDQEIEVTPEIAVEAFRRDWENRLTVEDPSDPADLAYVAARRAELAELRGRDLACWCALDQPCHADVLLELANA